MSHSTITSKLQRSIILLTVFSSVSLFSQDHKDHIQPRAKEAKEINTVNPPEKSPDEKEPGKPENEVPVKEKQEPTNKSASGGAHEHKGPMRTPAGLMIPHVQKSDDWMVDYMYMNMDMRHLYNGSRAEDPNKYLMGIGFDPSVNTIPASQYGTGTVHNHSTNTGGSAPDPLPSYYIASLNPGPYRYMSVPTSMKMEMAMLGLMKNINDKLAVMFMLPYMNNSMQSTSGNYEKSFMRTQGVGDMGVTLVYKMIDKDKHELNVQLGITTPTGSIDEKNLMPLMGRTRSPYNMQPGSGTYNSIPGFSYTYSGNRFTLGTFSQMILRNGKNGNSYRFGNRYEFSIWASYQLWDWLTPTFRITSVKWENVSGADPGLNYTMDPQNDPMRQGGRRIDLLAGLNFSIPSISDKIKAGIEFGAPVYQHLNGPQMGVSTLFNFRLQAVF